MPKTFPLELGWPLVLKDMGLCAADVLRRAGLPEDLFARGAVSLTGDEYFGLWRALEVEANDPLFPLHLGQSVPVEAFQPPLFAAMCSPNWVTAAARLAHYKRLIAPVAMHVIDEPPKFRVSLEWLDGVNPPTSLVATELVFLVQLVRTSTREPIRPLRVETPNPPTDPAYEEFFGVRVRNSKIHALTVSTADAHLPFLTANEAMWKTFEPSLRQRLSELDAAATTSDRVRAVLLEALPSGESSVDEIARRLATSKRTLQRRLKEEGVSYQHVLNRTRESLALHYLKSTELSGAEISYLLGYEDPNSFFRAFHEWTGTTTERARQAAALSS